jgi:hypothetical protein
MKVRGTNNRNRKEKYECLYKNEVKFKRWVSSLRYVIGAI